MSSFTSRADLRAKAAGVSLAQEEPITCPACNATSTAKIHRTVNTALDPAAKDDLLSGKLFAFACASCGRTTRVVHPQLVFHDPKAELMIQLDALGKVDPSSLPVTGIPKITRVVRDSNALLEKVKTFDAGFDDRVLEALKAVASSRHATNLPTRWLFEGTGTPKEPASDVLRFTILSTQGIAGTAVPRSAYDELRTRLDDQGALGDLLPWAVVDAEYARLLLNA